MKQAVVFLRGIKAGILTEDENGYTFEYDTDYLASAEAEAVSRTQVGYGELLGAGCFLVDNG